MTDEPFDDPRLTVVGLLIEVHAGLIAELTAVHAEHGLAGSDFDALLRLARSPGRSLRMSDLATQTGLSTSGVTRIVDRLERRGLVRRDFCATDRRSCWAVLTDAGHDALRGELPALLAVIQRRVVDPLSPAELDGLAQGLRALRDAVRPGAATTTEGEGADHAEP
ncbi:MarR family winged helix-turn-helix transcriptional regulator [Allokutzneria albata]|uniref:DNA-binding transcriptional regulator, MarR family n=1 Tax=Allokutzneria albata TaxID=211114 RepID=A0A1G9SXB3_ALLAB|nr:MarR family transcriptional regulator [Allokutzneria albata]SDM39495.1 DNA-binding transcriptional regulator, MarR family [Allokutzneria albata]